MRSLAKQEHGTMWLLFKLLKSRGEWGLGGGWHKEGHGWPWEHIFSKRILMEDSLQVRKESVVRKWRMWGRPQIWEIWKKMKEINKTVLWGGFRVKKKKDLLFLFKWGILCAFEERRRVCRKEADIKGTRERGASDVEGFKGAGVGRGLDSWDCLIECSTARRMCHLCAVAYSSH